MSDEKKPGVPLGARLKHLAVGTLMGLAIGGGWAGYVWWTGAQAVTDAQNAHQADLVAAKKAAEGLNESMEQQRRKIAYLGALAEIGRARQALDKQNYGVVSDHMKKAAQRLEGVDGAKVIAGRLAGMKVDAAAPETAKDVIDGLAGELEALGKDW